ncbi:MAG: cohesin domain-containing protein [Candidatus Yanofskybacteria bacterium]|nr:cohesin domain-containing protein [Candidatus Yanofskybacteria bacterium]
MKFLRRVRISVIAVLCLTAAGLFFNAFSSDAAETSLYLSPTSGRRNVGETFSIVVRMNTGGSAVNAAEGSIVFNASKIEVVSISKAGSVFSLWTTEPVYSNAEGTIEFGGGLTSPGYTGSNGLILTMTFRGTSATTINNATHISIVSGAILANDGQGTNILTSLGRSSWFIDPRGAIEQPEFDEEPVITGSLTPTVVSKTHPDKNKWYNNGSPEFSWALPAGVDNVSYLVTERATSNPGSIPDGLKSNIQFSGIKDGIWYFHLKFRRNGTWGPIAHYVFQVDTTPPDAVTVARADTEDETNPQPILLIEGSDATSGIDRFEMKIDGDDSWISLEKSDAVNLFKLPLQKPGAYDFSVRAFDKAGNIAAVPGTLVVKSIEVPTIERYPDMVQKGEKLVVAGKAESGYKIHVPFVNRAKLRAQLMEEKGTVVEKAEAVADENGEWEIEILNIFSGTYSVYAYAEDSRGAVSLPSSEVTVRVKSSLFGGVAEFFTRLLGGIFLEKGKWFAISLMFYIVIFGLLIAYVMHRRPQLQWFGSSKKRRHTKAAPDHSVKEYIRTVERISDLEGDIEKELDLLKKVSAHRSLYPEEKYLKSKFSRYLKVLKKSRPK